MSVSTHFNISALQQLSRSKFGWGQPCFQPPATSPLKSQLWPTTETGAPARAMSPSPNPRTCRMHPYGCASNSLVFGGAFEDPACFPGGGYVLQPAPEGHLEGDPAYPGELRRRRAPVFSGYVGFLRWTTPEGVSRGQGTVNGRAGISRAATLSSGSTLWPLSRFSGLEFPATRKGFRYRTGLVI